jgi:hypothetical protein
MASSLQTTWAYVTNSWTNYFIFDTTLAALATAFPTVLGATTLTKVSSISWSNVQAGYTYNLLLSPDSNFTTALTTTNLSGASAALTSLFAFSNLIAGSTNYYALVSVQSNTPSAPSYIYAGGLGSFVFQDDPNPMSLGAVSVANELYVPDADPTNYTLYFSATEANGAGLSYVFTFYTNTNVVIEVRSNVTGNSLDIRLLTNYAGLPDNLAINWEVTTLVNSHQTVKNITGVSRNFFLNKANDAPSVSNLSAPLDGRIYLNDPIIIQQVGDPDPFDTVSNEFVASLFPAFPAFSLYAVVTTNRRVHLSDFSNGTGTGLIQDLGTSNALYVRMRAFDNRSGSSGWLSATNAILSPSNLFAGLNDLRIVAPVPVSPISLSVTQGHGGSLTWTNAVLLPATNSSGQPLLYAMAIGTNAAFTGLVMTNVDLSFPGSVTFSQVDFPALPHLSPCYFRLQAYYGYGNAGGLYGTNLGIFTFFDDHPPTGQFSLISSNEVFNGILSERNLTWAASIDPDGDKLTYDLYISPNSSPSASISTNTNLSTNVLDITAVGNFSQFQDNTTYYVMITNIRDTHGRECTNYPDLLSYWRTFHLNRSNDNPLSPTNLAFAPPLPATNFALCNSKSAFSCSTTDPDLYDNGSLQYKFYLFSTNYVNLSDFTNATNYFFDGMESSNFMFRYDTTSNQSSIFEIISRASARDLTGPGLTNGRAFIFGVKAEDRRGGQSPLWIYTNILVYSNNNLPPTKKPGVVITNGLLGASVSWTNGADPDDASLLYRIEISDTSAFATVLSSTNGVAQQGSSNAQSSLALASIPGFSSLTTGRAYFLRMEGHDPWDGTNLGFTAPVAFYLPRLGEDLDDTEFHIADLASAYAGRSGDTVLRLSLASPGMPDGMLLRLRRVPYASIGSKTNYAAWVSAFAKVFPNRNRRVVNSMVYDVGVSKLDGTLLPGEYSTALRLALSTADAGLLPISNTGYYRMASFGASAQEWNVLDGAVLTDGLLGWNVSSNSTWTVIAAVTPTEALSSPLAFPNPVSLDQAGRVSLAVVTTAAGSLEIQVLDLRGRMIFKTRQEVAAAGEGKLQVYSWDGRDTFGQLCAPGVYVVRYLFTAPGQTTLIKTCRIGVK